MNRVRAGLTGLGLVFLFTLLASVAFAPSVAVLPDKSPGEPLAQLGVAPSSEKMDSLPAGPAANAARETSPAAPGTQQPMVAVPDAALSSQERGALHAAI